MLRAAGVVLLGIVCCVLAAGSLRAGAEDGKRRWTEKRTGQCKWYPAIKVPAAEGDTPGKWEMKITFKGGELAEFFVIGDGDTDLDLYILDAEGRPVKDKDGKEVKDEDPAEPGSDLCVCRWTPEKTAEFTVRVVNRGRVYNMVQAGCN